MRNIYTFFSQSCLETGAQLQPKKSFIFVQLLPFSFQSSIHIVIFIDLSRLHCDSNMFLCEEKIEMMMSFEKWRWWSCEQKMVVVVIMEITLKYANKCVFKFSEQSMFM